MFMTQAYLPCFCVHTDLAEEGRIVPMESVFVNRLNTEGRGRHASGRKNAADGVKRLPSAEAEDLIKLVDFTRLCALDLTV